MNIGELTKGIHKVASSHACGLMAEIIRRKIVDKNQAVALLRETEEARHWDTITDLWKETDKLEALLMKAENKTKVLLSRGF